MLFRSWKAVVALVIKEMEAAREFLRYTTTVMDTVEAERLAARHAANLAAGIKDLRNVLESEDAPSDLFAVVTVVEGAAHVLAVFGEGSTAFCRMCRKTSDHLDEIIEAGMKKLESLAGASPVAAA